MSLALKFSEKEHVYLLELLHIIRGRALKKALISLVCLIGLLAIFSSAQAGTTTTTYTLTPNPSNLNNLDHGYYYDWAINWNVPAGQKIVGATLTFSNINDWTYEPNNNVLYTHLLDTVPTNGTKIGTNVYQWSDGEVGGDNWKNQGVLVGTYVDKSTNPETLTYDLAKLGLLPTLTQYASDGKFGFGFDPDCHYNNCGVSLKVTTAPVPEPGTLAVFGSGLMGLVSFASRRRKIK